MNRLQRLDVLPEVWIAPGGLRDRRELPRTRTALAAMRTGLKCRMHAILEKWGLGIRDVSDIFGRRGRQLIAERLEALGPQTAETMRVLLAELDALERAIAQLEGRMREVFEPTETVQLLRTLPGVGRILSVVIDAEVGDVRRFGRAAALASYSGVVPRVHASGGKWRGGPTRRDVNRYLKRAFVEAANGALLHRARYAHVGQLYERIRPRRGHGRAVVAVARHLAESSWWVLTKREPYEAPDASMRG
jgi:transposase